MTPKWSRKIEIEKIHPDPLLSLGQAVTANGSDFLGTVLTMNDEVGARAARPLALRPGAYFLSFCPF